MRTDLAQQLEGLLNRLVLRSSRATILAPALAIAPPGVDAQTYPILNALLRTGPISAARLGEQIGVDRSGASRYADRLEDLGLLKRRMDPLDRRATLLSLTPKGVRVVEKLNAALADHLHEAFTSWPRGQAEALVDGLELLLGEAATRALPRADADADVTATASADSAAPRSRGRTARRSSAASR